MRPFDQDRILGLACVVFALVLLFVWVPLDTETGLVERARGKFVVGDGLAPTLAGVVLLIAGLLIWFSRAADEPRLDGAHIRFLLSVVAIVAFGILIMRGLGPVIADLAGAGEYRLLRDTRPWKYIGFASGGLFIVSGLVALIEGRLGRRALLTGLFAVVVIIALYDLPFDDLLLPPNGDV